MPDVIDILTTPFMGAAAWLWVSFLGIVITLLVIDLGVLQREHHEIGIKESLMMSAGYITFGLMFGGWIWYEFGATRAMEYYTGYLIEQSLSMDNVFVMALIFGYFQIPRKYQHEVLFWGVLGAIVMRGIMIGIGAALVQRFDWILYVFGAFLLISGFKMLFSHHDQQPDLAQNTFLQFLRKHIRVTDQLHGDRFIIRKPHPGHDKPIIYATPLLLALILIEMADLVFAIDSVPAIFSITQEPFIVYTSNICAILGLRALYFALAAMISRFAYLKYALALVLVFIGGKIFMHAFIAPVPAPVSLGVTFGLLVSGVMASLIKTRQPPKPSATKQENTTSSQAERNYR
ncbi:tellurite resistance protein TerC [Pseudomonas duriflava]|uniref:Tellurite resistance protein TerC n=1 Tax=Pseudomonas duriflava TaxID=459528 RepID=A0A562Q7P1_9PSED|nr:TerC family protein [Pseudomonas duriflava]TWI52767.1 tellurite resistance protein TerC [Pseudomonas duriflava]